MTDSKHIAIISNGPSARLFDMAKPGYFDTVIGVNWTVRRWFCDWWCFCDWPTFVETQPINRPKICTSEFVIRKLPDNEPEHAERLRTFEIVIQQEIDLPPLPPDLPKWNSFSGCAALGLAWHLKAKQVVVFGADMAGSLDHAGRFGNSRTPDRWAQERKIWNGLVTAFDKAGMTVERILSVCDGAEPTSTSDR